MSPEAQALVDRLGLEPHPEGGWFREIYRADEDIVRADGETRSAMTLIHFLLAAGDISRWHVVSSDEVWHFYEGSALELLVYDPSTETLETARLGPIDVEGRRRHHVVPRGHWQAARSLGEFTLVGCSVAPGFSFDDFRFVADLPDHDAHIRRALEGTSSLL